MWSSYQVQVPGKWVLSGEHAVLRGATAVALPHPELGLSLTFQPQVWEGLSIVPASAAQVVSELIDSIQDAWEQKGRSFPSPRGTLEIQSSIPVGAGLGSSAALCVAIGRWMSEPLGLGLGPLGSQELLEFATQLEHRFHGQSSGMDVAVIASNEPVAFVRGRGPRSLGVKRLPRFTFHDTGLRCRTNECVAQVEALRAQNPGLGLRLDESMGEASRQAMEGLVQYERGDSARGQELIARAMRQGQECFRAWKLMPEEARGLEESLLNQGALAVKLTGAGGGGMLVALWEKP